MVMQDVNYQLFSDSVREEVLLVANRPELCEAVLEALGLTEFADRHPISCPEDKNNEWQLPLRCCQGKNLLS